MDILHDGKLIALVIESFEQDGTRPQTDGAFPLQLLMMKHPKGTVFPGHTHAPRTRVLEYSQEAIVITKGSLRIRVLTRTGEFVSEVVLNAGQCFFVVDGASEIEVIEDTEFYEFKTGPFLDDKVSL